MFYVAGPAGETFGPVAVETLKAWLEEGRVDASSLVCRQGETSWVAITAHPELASLFPTPAGPGLPPPPPPVPPRAPSGPNQPPSPDEKNLGMALHLSNLAGLVVPYGGLVVPLVIWLLNREKSRFIEKQGWLWLNACVSYVIYSLPIGFLCFIVIGIPLAVALLAVWVVGSIRAALAAQKGEFQDYPLVLKLFKGA